MGGGGKGGTSRQVYDFLLSVDYGVCYGPVTSINRVLCKDKTVTFGQFTESGVVEVNKPDLYGGDDGEGGATGKIEIYMGDQTQLMSSHLSGRFELTPPTAPGYRGLCHLFFRGEDTDETEVEDVTGSLAGIFQRFLLAVQQTMTTVASGAYGFLWTSNNPYLPPAQVEATREPVGLTYSGLIYPIIGVDEETGEYIIAGATEAWDGEDFDPTKAPDANPAAMIYEVYTNDEWGKGEPASAMYIQSFEDAAATLDGEHFGLSLLWNKQDSFENFVAEVLDHIKGMVFQDPQTGLWTMKLIRDDYDLADAIVLDPSNCDAEAIRTTLWGETINEVKVEYTDPESEETETVSSQNIANISIQGGVISDTRDYTGVRNPWLAQEIADRDVIEASRTLTSATVYVNRAAFNKKPGDMAVFTWPDEEIDSMVMRIMGVDYGKPKDRRIKLELTEDIFSVRKTPVVATQGPPAADSDTPDVPDRVLLMTPPMPPLIAQGVDATEIDANYPVSYVSFSVGDTFMSIIDILADSDITLANGDPAIGPVATFLPVRSAALGVALVPEARSTVPNALLKGILRREPEIGMVFIIGASEEDHELVLLDSYDSGTKLWTVMRGIWDTQPRTWGTTDIIWELKTTGQNVDFTDRAAGSPVSYWLRPRTADGRLAFADADETIFTPSERMHLPFRPADVEIDGNGFSDTQYLGGTIPATIEATWANRNRLGEDAVTLAWDDMNMAPETDQTVTLQFWDTVSGVMEFEVTGLASTSYTLDPADVADYRFYEMRAFSVRDGLESRETVVRNLELERLGYGNNYGYDYGENDGG